MASLVGPYQYAPLLPGRNIRVLLLYPDINFTAPLRCSLLQLSLDRLGNGEGSYEALSYVWGSENRSHKILCDGHTITITRNCFLALKHLRLVSQARALWVDAICIDQSSISERSQQVRLMGDIYKLALTVLIWLGEGDAKTDAILRRVRKLNTLCRFLYQSQLTRPLEDIACQLFRFIPLSDLPSEWYTRGWTFQELVLANHPALVCGFSSCPWNEKGFIHSWVKSGLSRIHPDYLMEKSHELMTCAARLVYLSLRKRFSVFAPDQLPPNTLQQNTLRKAVYSGKTIDPNDLRFALERHEYTMAGSMDPFAIGILWFCHVILAGVFQRKTVDARDIVFCLHGVMSDLNFRLPEPDYNLPVAVIYENFAVSIMRRTNSLLILTSLFGVFGTPEWPSWVPNLSKGDPEPEGREPAIRHLLWSEDDLACSGCRFRPTFQLVHQPGRLTVEGIKFATITSFGSILRRPTLEQLEEPGKRGHFIFDAFCWLQDLLEAARDEVCPRGNKRRDAFYHTLAELEGATPTTGVIKPGISIERLAGTWMRDLAFVDWLCTDKDYTPLFDQHRQEVAAARGGLPRQGTKTAADKLFNTMIPTDRFVGAILARIADLCYASPIRVPFVLSNGSVGMGNVPEYQIGDCVTFMYGSNLPIVIRPDGAAYRFVGLAAVKGIPVGLWPLEHGKDQGDVELITLI
ncbi:heterokaryon incompatibility protein-domain-containing protein [Podospora conica]|nr:heterokaryon incompatibility protein-domain-containing protein [Schizothecium conicum]